MATITLPKIYLNFETSLAASMTSSATSFTLSRSTDDDAATLSGTFFLTIDEGTSTEEHMIVTLSGAAATVVTRGISRVDGSTNKSANQFAHNRGATVKITNAPLVQLIRLLAGTDTFNSVNWLGVNSISGLATPTSGETTKAANVNYVNNTAIAGAPDAADAVKGLVEIATNTEAVEGDDTGSTTAPVVLKPSVHLQTMDMMVTTDYTYGDTISVGNALYFDNVSGKVKRTSASASGTCNHFVGFALDAGVDTDTGKRVQVGGIVTGLSGLTSGGYVYLQNAAGAIGPGVGTIIRPVGKAISTTALKIYDSNDVSFLSEINSATNTTNFNESMTFFANTAFSAANANTLTGGVDSDAASLHIHAETYFSNGVRSITRSLFWETFDIPLSSALCTTANYTVTALGGGYFDGTASGASPSVRTTGAIYYNATKEVIIKFSLAVSLAGTSEMGWGLSDNIPTAVADYDDATRISCMFTVDASGNLYAHTAAGGGGANHTEVQITGVTLTNQNVYAIHFRPGTDARFYVNNTLRATITTFLPGSATVLRFGFGGSGATNYPATVTVPHIAVAL